MPPPLPCEQVCFIVGAGHSGSTLLGMVLGSHSGAFYAGEAKKSRFLGDARRPLRKRACKLCGLECPIWRRVGPGPVERVHERLSEVTRRPHIVDSAKEVAWVETHSRALLARGIRVDLIFLTRDGRAVLGSRARKYPERPVAEHIDAWVKQIRATEALMGGHAGPRHRLRYEALATSPAETVKTLCEALGWPYEPEMLHYEAHDHHPLGGNNGTQYVATRLRRPDALVKMPERSRDYYANLNSGFHLDLRWRSELSAEALAMFQARAGAFNEEYQW